jgi:hypothetical protein
MLYHRIGIPFDGECYVYEKGENDIERERMKSLSLIAINSTRDKASGAILKKWLKENIFPEGEEHPILDRMNLFMEHHSPIKEFLFSGIGIDLQYYDSKIMESILKRCLKCGVPALPVHDSVIVPISFKDEIVVIMVEEYEKVMKFPPVIG